MRLEIEFQWSNAIHDSERSATMKDEKYFSGMCNVREWYNPILDEIAAALNVGLRRDHAENVERFSHNESAVITDLQKK